MDCVISLCFLPQQEYLMVISTDKLELVVIEKRNLLLCISMIFDIHDFYEMYFICMYATIAAFLLTFKVKV